MLCYSQALILSILEQRSMAISNIFGLIAGTSGGAIIGACAASSIPILKVCDFFTEFGPQIFKHSWYTNIENLIGPEYSSDTLEKALQSVLGDLELKDCGTDLVITAFDVVKGKPVFFKSYESSSENNDQIVIGNDSNIKLWQICRASSAAQTYFSAYSINDMILIDGGNCSVNCPDILAITELAQYVDIKDIELLSLGNGESKWNVDGPSLLNPNIIKAGLATINIVFAAGEDVQVDMARKLLGNRYYRLSPDLGDGLAIDDAAGCLSKIPPAVNVLLDSTTALNQFIVSSQPQPHLNI